MLARIGIALDFPKSRQLEISWCVVGGNGDDRATILEGMLEPGAIELGRLDIAGPLAIGRVVRSHLYRVYGGACLGWGSPPLQPRPRSRLICPAQTVDLK